MSQFKTDKDLRVAIHKAIKHCIASGIMVELLQRHEMEVTDVLFTEFDQESFIDYTKKKSFEDGIRQGREQSIRDTVIRCLKAGKSPEEISELLGYDIELIKEIEKDIKSE